MAAESLSVSEEPRITVNGVELSLGQAMTLRVALTTFHMEMGQPEALGKDEHGLITARNYRQRAEEVLVLMVGNRK